MAFFRRIEDFFQRPPANSVNFSDAEKELRRKQLLEDFGPFTYTEDGFLFQTADRSESVKWTDIEQVVAFKLDRLTYDLICLRLFWLEGDLLITEDEPGWYPFTERLNAALPVAKNWEATVAQPPFETSETLVYLKDFL